jgi:cytochrome c oxidase subunit 3
MRKQHYYHILPLSPWPILSGFSALFMVSGLAFYMHNVELGGFVFISGLLSLCFCVFFWFSDIIDEATFSGFHTNAVRSGLRLGFMLFIISELCYFLVFFERFFMQHYVLQ